MSEQQPTRELTFEFRGTGIEYFKIWIINLLLTIVTLGIYSPWAKVRNNKYLYNHLYLDDYNFDYHAQPLNILLGRVIALGVFMILVGIGQVYPIWGGAIFFVVILVLAPWIVVSSFSFRNRNSSYKNLRFDFTGDYKGAFITFGILPLAGAISFGLLMPLVLRQIRKYVVDNTCYGTSSFEFTAAINDYFMAFLKILGMGFVLAVGAGVLTTFGAAVPAIAFIGGIAMMAVYLLIYAYYVATIENLKWNASWLQTNYFTSDLKTVELATLFFTNALLMIVTLGLAFPAIKVRVAAYKASRIVFVACEDLDTFIANEQKQAEAVGQELGEVFDFDLGF